MDILKSSQLVVFSHSTIFTVAQKDHTCKFKMLLQTKKLTCKLKMLLQIKNSTCKLKIVLQIKMKSPAHAV